MLVHIVGIYCHIDSGYLFSFADFSLSAVPPSVLGYQYGGLVFAIFTRLASSFPSLITGTSLSFLVATSVAWFTLCGSML